MRKKITKEQLDELNAIHLQVQIMQEIQDRLYNDALRIMKIPQKDSIDNQKAMVLWDSIFNNFKTIEEALDWIGVEVKQ